MALATSREEPDILKALDVMSKTSLQYEARQRLLENCRKAKLMVRDNTPLDGNCFFHAVSDQLSLLGLPPLTHVQLRNSVAQYLREHPYVQGPDGIVDFSAIYPDWEAFCDTISKDGEWADAVVLVATAHMLQTDILVVTSSPQGENDQIFHRVISNDDCRGPPLMLGHVWELHYVSLQPIPTVSPKVQFGSGGITYIYGPQTIIEGNPTIVSGDQINVAGDQIKAITDSNQYLSYRSNNKEIEDQSSVPKIEAAADNSHCNQQPGSNNKVSEDLSVVPKIEATANNIPSNQQHGSNSKAIKDVTSVSKIEDANRPSCEETKDSVFAKTTSFDLQQMMKLDPGPSIVGSFDLKQCQEQLRWYYLNYLCRVPLYPGDHETCVDLVDIYTKLTIVLDLPQPCQPIKIPLKTHDEIFTRRSSTDDVITRILISGDAGVGKTMLTTRLAYDWATSNPDTSLLNIPLLFVVNMRWVDRSSNIEDVILTQLLPEDTDISRKDLADIIRQLGTKVIIVLDAIDEAHGDLFDHPNRKSGNIVKALLGRNLLETRVVVTTRPWRLNEIISYNKSFTRFEIQGFAKLDVTAYIRRFFRRDEDLGDQLIRYMEENELVNSLATIPLMSLLFCLYWRETGAKLIPKRLGQLYDSILCIMQNHMQSKQAERAIQPKQLRGIYKHVLNFTASFKPRPEIKEIILKLGKPALNGVWPPENRLVFSYDDIEEDAQSAVVKEACEIGLLSKEESPSILKDRSKVKPVSFSRNAIMISAAILSIFTVIFFSGSVVTSIFTIICFTSAYLLLNMNYHLTKQPVDQEKQQKLAFFHKSAQEKCAGEYLASLAQDRPHKLQSYLDSIETLKDALSISMILRFACSASSKATNEILEKLLALYRVHIKPWMAHFHEEKLGLDDTRTIQQYLDLCLGCNYEADTKELFCPLLSGLFPEGQLNSLGMSSLSAVSIAYFIAHSRSDSIRSITLRPVANINEPLVAQGPLSEILQKALHGIQFSLSEGQVLKICDAYFDSKQRDVHRDCKVLFSKSPTLMLAHLQVIQACEGLPFTAEANLTPIIDSFHFTQIDKLDFSELKLGRHIDNLISVIERGQLMNLLELSVKAIGMTGYQTQRLAASLSKARQLNLLDISGNEPGRSFYTLAQVLPGCPSLWVLDIGDMTATTGNMTAIIEAIPNFASQLEQLCIHGNIMNDAVGTAFIQSISTAHALMCLEISVAGVSRDSHDNILKSLGQLPRLVKLGIWGSPFCDALLKCISQVLDKLPSLRYLRLNGHYNVSPNISHSTWVQFRGKLLAATKLHFLALVNICLEDIDFQNLLTVCRGLGYAYLGYSMECLPEGMDVPKDNFFNIL